MMRETVNLRSLSVARLGLSIDSRVHSHKWGTVRSDIVLVSSEGASLRCNAFQLLLGRCVRIADRQRQSLLTKPGAGETLDDLVTDFAGLEARYLSVTTMVRQNLREPDLPAKTNTSTVAKVVSKDLTRQDVVAKEDCRKFLQLCVSVKLEFQIMAGRSYHLSEGLGKVGHVQVSRLSVAFGLQARVERLLKEVSKGMRHVIWAADSGKANFIFQTMKATNAKFGVSDVVELGKAESAKHRVSLLRRVEGGVLGNTYPLQAPVVLSIMAFEVLTRPNRSAYFLRVSSSVVGWRPRMYTLRLPGMWLARLCSRDFMFSEGVKTAGTARGIGGLRLRSASRSALGGPAMGKKPLG